MKSNERCVRPLPETGASDSMNSQSKKRPSGLLRRAAYLRRLEDQRYELAMMKLPVSHLVDSSVPVPRLEQLL